MDSKSTPQITISSIDKDQESDRNELRGHWLSARMTIEGNGAVGHLKICILLLKEVNSVDVRRQILLDSYKNFFKGSQEIPYLLIKTQFFTLELGRSGFEPVPNHLLACMIYLV